MSAAVDGLWCGRIESLKSSAEPPARRDQIEAVEAKARGSPRGDPMMCVIPQSWWVLWKKHVDKEAAAPPRIDLRDVTRHSEPCGNTTLSEYIGLSLDIKADDDWTDDGRVAYQHERVTVVSRAVGALLCSWYGGDLAMHPRVRAEPGAISECPIDLRPLAVHVQYWLFSLEETTESGGLADGHGEQAEGEELIECSVLMQRHARVDQLEKCVLEELEGNGDSKAHDPKKAVMTHFNAREMDFRMWAASFVDDESAMLTLLINSPLHATVALDSVPALRDTSADRVFVRMHGRYTHTQSWGTAIDAHDLAASAPVASTGGLPTVAHSDTSHEWRINVPSPPLHSLKRKKVSSSDLGCLSTKTASDGEWSGGGGWHRDEGFEASRQSGKSARFRRRGGATSSPQISSYTDSHYPGTGHRGATSSPPNSPYMDSHHLDEMDSWNVTRKGVETYETAVKAAGIVGLRNLGNTCFLNSILQCLLHMRPLRRIFGVEGGGAWKDAINTSNRDGTGGELAKEFAKLMKAAWSEEYSCLKPVKFKNVLGRFVPHLAGFAQQDSQEALGAIIDKLQEDLNLCAIKPYIERPEGDGRSLEDDDRVAAEAMAGHKKRNDSVIGDAVSGFYRNRMECCNASCSRVSVTFDPFNQLTLTLPSKHCMPRTFRATYVPADGSSPIEIAAVVSGEKSVAELLDAMRDAIRTDARQLSAIRCEDHAGATAVYCEVDADGVGDDVGDANFPGGVPVDEPRLEQARLVSGDSSSSSSVGGELPHLVITGLRWTSETSGCEINVVFAPSASVASIKSDQNLLVYAVELPGAEQDGDGKEEDPGEAALRSAAHTSAAAPRGGGGGDASAGGSAMRVEGSASGESQEGASSSRSSCVAVAYVVVRQMVEEGGTLRCLGRPVVVAYRPNVTTYRTLRENIAMQLRGYMHQLTAFDDAALPFSLHTHGSSHRPSAKYQLDSKSGSNSLWGVEGDDLCVVAPGKMPQYRNYGASAYERKQNAAAKHFDATLLWECAPEMLDRLAMNAVRPTHMLAAPKEGGDGGTKPGIDLQQLLERFSAREQLETDNTWYCSACKEHVRAHKQLTLWSTSDVLVVHLKRFSHERSWLEKNEMMVRFPLNGLDLRPYRGPKSAVAALGGATGDAPSGTGAGAGAGAAEGAAASGDDDGGADALYDLVGVSHHMGGMGGGHYVASVRANDGNWCVCLRWR